MVGVHVGADHAVGERGLDGQGAGRELPIADTLGRRRLDAATVLGARTPGDRYGVVRHIGPEAELVVVGTTMIHVFELDENLFPHRKLTASSGPHRVSGTFLHVRSLGGWTLELRP
ncbi:hypothetical protein QF037_006040 [Streptomyces canus]|uniref:hypothetical protein n=1 Tax=Streptomyces canus TaxID=58343 RepID=UPI00277D1B84|nr:hypothetical protein [Streptomyces canus]MDQ0601695.1 hypothetical protein [Streptomyces canus]